jgi:hypothetical protein
MGSKLFVFCEKSEQRERGLRVAAQKIHAGSGAPKKENAPIQNRGAPSYEKKYSTSEKFVKENLQVPQRFFYSILFKHMEGWKNGNGRSRLMKKRKDCTCPCHRAPGAVLHVVPCCDAMPALPRPRKKSKGSATKPSHA